MEMMLNHQISIRDLLDLCPRIKERVLKKWIAGLNMELKEINDKASCKMTQPEEVCTTRDDNVAKINIKINSQEIKGVILDGGSV